MYSTCLFCHAPLGKNEAIEHFPVGRWLAFDSAKGRLWVVCRACERWSLSPVEERWEAIEECERAFSETKLRASTEQVGLARLREGTTLVRIGAPQRPEMAAWRYGDQFGRRRQRYIMMSAAAAAAIGGFLIVGPMTGVIGGSSVSVLNIARTVRGVRPVLTLNVGGRKLKLSRDALNMVQLRRRGLFDYELEVPYLPPWREKLASLRPGYPQNEPGYFATTYPPLVVRGEEAVHIARTLLPRINASGGNTKTVTTAVTLLERASGNRDVFASLASTEYPAARRRWGASFDPQFYTNVPNRLIALPPSARLAMEMALHEEDERRALEGELTVLEERWKEAEEIAAISDDMFLPASILDRVRRRD